MHLLAANIVFAIAGCAYAQNSPAPVPSFNIQGFEIAGNTLLPAEALERAVAPFTGASREISDVQRAVEALAAAYHERGYTMVRISVPEQDITSGVVRLQVRQGRVGKVTVDKNQHFSTANIRASLPSIREGDVPNAMEVARNLHLLNEHPVKRTNVQWRHGRIEGDIDVAFWWGCPEFCVNGFKVSAVSSVLRTR